MTNKEIVFSVLLGVSAAIAGFAWDRILGNPIWAICILMYAVIFAVFLVLTKNLYAKWGVSAGSLIVFALFFKIDGYWAAGLALSLLIVAYGVQSVIDDEAASVKVVLKRRAGPTIKIFFTGVAVFLSFIYFGGIHLNPNPERMILQESVFKLILKSLEVPLQGAIPGFRADATTGELFGPQERDAFAAQYGLNLSGKEKIADVLYIVALSRIKAYAGNFLEYVPAIAALTYFLALKSVSSLLYFVALILIYIIFRLLIMAGIVQKIKIPTEQEIYI